MKNFDYYLNPFARNDLQPKIPDGELSTSIGLQSRHLQEFGSDRTNAQPNNEPYSTVYIAMLPGIYTVAAVFGQLTTGEFQLVKLINETDILDFVNGGPNTPPTAAGLPFSRLALRNHPSFWRVVSQGMRILPISSSIFIDGYYETVSLPFNNIPSHWHVGIPQTINQNNLQTDDFLALGKNGLGCWPTVDFIEGLEASRHNWRDSQTHNTGTLLDLPNYQFQQKVNNPEHTPQSLSDTYRTDTMLTNDGNQVDMLKEIFDQNHQVRFFRLRVPKIRDADDPRVYFSLNVQTNYELQYPYGNRIRSFQTNNLDVENVAQMDRERNQQNMANNRGHGVQANNNLAVTPDNAQMDVVEPSRRRGRQQELQHRRTAQRRLMD